jgi:hypothetical protein
MACIVASGFLAPAPSSAMTIARHCRSSSSRRRRYSASLLRLLLPSHLHQSPINHSSLLPTQASAADPTGRRRVV